MGKYEDALNEQERGLLLGGEVAKEIANGKQQILESLKTSGPKGYWTKSLEFTKRTCKTVNTFRLAILPISLQSLGNVTRRSNGSERP